MRDKSYKQQPLAVERVVREHVERVLEFVDGNKSRAAELLGVSRRTVIRWAKKEAA